MINVHITARARRALDADKLARYVAGNPDASEEERQKIIDGIAQLEIAEEEAQRIAFNYRLRISE